MEIAEHASSANNLEAEITKEETHLQDLRNEYMKLTGHMPVKKINDFEWKWSIFMGIGFAYISLIFYLLGIAKDGKDAGFGIPAFFFGTDIMFYAILTMYTLLMVMMAQARKLSGLQSMAFLLGFWCTQWLFYDWGWYAYKMGIHEISNDPGFWNSFCGRNFLVMNTPMWLFLTEAIVGFLIGVYTFTFPRSRRHVIPPILWLYGTYFNAYVLYYAGVSAESIFVVAICILVAIFGLIGFFIVERIHAALPKWRSMRASPAAGENAKRKWKLSSDPLGFPVVFVMVGLVATTHLFLILSPVIGLFFGLIPWYFVPIYYIMIRSTGIARMTKKRKIAVMCILTGLFVGFLVAACVPQWLGNIIAAIG